MVFNRQHMVGIIRIIIFHLSTEHGDFGEMWASAIFFNIFILSVYISVSVKLMNNSSKCSAES